MRAAGGGAPSEAFAGVTSWDPVRRTLTWDPQLDLHPGARVDCGRIEWVDGDLIEHGTADLLDETVHYTEVFRRRSLDGAPVVIADRIGGSGRLAWCGIRGAVLIDDRPAGLVRGGSFVDHGWAWVLDLVLGSLPGAIRLTAGADPALGVEPGAELDLFGARWRVVEVGPRV